MSRILNRRHPLRVAAIVVCVAMPLTAAPAIARLLHATLLRSTPAANSHLAKSPETVRLVFSEQVVPELSQITVVNSNGDSARLKIANDPHDVHVLIGSEVGTLSGRCKVVWRVLSADGHPVGGNFTFIVGSDTATATPPSVTTPVGTSARIPPASNPAVTPLDTAGPAASSDEKPVPIVASLFRGVGLGAFMTGIGILFFGLSAGERRILIPGALVTSLIAVGTLLLVAHSIAWLEHASPTGHLTADFMSSMLGSAMGRVELVRVALAVLTLWAMALARHRKIALWLGVACIVLSLSLIHI